MDIGKLTLIQIQETVSAATKLAGVIPPLPIESMTVNEMMVTIETATQQMEKLNTMEQINNFKTLNQAEQEAIKRLGKL